MRRPSEAVFVWPHVPRTCRSWRDGRCSRCSRRAPASGAEGGPRGAVRPSGHRPAARRLRGGPGLRRWRGVAETRGGSLAGGFRQSFPESSPGYAPMLCVGEQPAFFPPRLCHKPRCSASIFGCGTAPADERPDGALGCRGSFMGCGGVMAFVDPSLQGLRIARAQVAKMWGPPHSAILVACVVSGMRRLATRSACSVVSRPFRWRSGVDISTLKHLVKGQLKLWARGLPENPHSGVCVRASG